MSSAAAATESPTLLDLARTKFPDLTEPEEKLCTGIQENGGADFSIEVGKPWKKINPSEDDLPEIRAEVLAWVLSDTTARGCLGHRGVMVAGARITGHLNLISVEFPFRFGLFHCYMPDGMNMEDASFGPVNFGGSHTGPLSANRISVKGSVFLNDKFTAKGEVCLLNATIGGNLECKKGSFQNPGGHALCADGIAVKGDVFLNKQFAATGAVRLLGAIIDGNLECSNGTFENPEGKALNAEQCKVGGHIFLEKLTTSGIIDLTSADIGQILALRDGTWKDDSTLLLCGAHCATLGDRFEPDANGPIDAWPAAGHLNLDGFTYDSIADDAPKDANRRLQWIDRQPDDQYRPQPYEQLAKVLRKSGHEADAKQMLIAKNEKLAWFLGHRTPEKLRRWHMKRFLRADKTDLPAIFKEIQTIPKQLVDFPERNWRSRWWHSFYGMVAGYGYKPFNILISMIILILLGTGVFFLGMHTGGMTASQTFQQICMDGNGDPVHDPHPAQQADQLRIKTEPYPEFYAFLYSLDAFVPLVDLHQETYYMPDPNFPYTLRLFKGSAWKIPLPWINIYLAFHIFMGWFFTLLFVAIVSGMVRKDDTPK